METLAEKRCKLDSTSFTFSFFSSLNRAHPERSVADTAPSGRRPALPTA